jgi:hypothetical protein
MVQLLEAGFETTVPDFANKKETDFANKKESTRAAAPQKHSGVEIIDTDGCCILCGGGAADLLCTFPCPSTTTAADAEDVASICGCM